MKTLIIKDESIIFEDCTELINSLYLWSFSTSVIEGTMIKYFNDIKIFSPDKVHNINVNDCTKFNSAVLLIDYCDNALCILSSLRESEITPIFSNLYITQYEIKDIPNIDLYSEFVTNKDYKLVYLDNQNPNNKVYFEKINFLKGYVEFHNKLSSYFISDYERYTYYYGRLTLSIQNTQYVKYETYNTIQKGEF